MPRQDGDRLVAEMSSLDRCCYRGLVECSGEVVDRWSVWCVWLGVVEAMPGVVEVLLDEHEAAVGSEHAGEFGCGCVDVVEEVDDVHGHHRIHAAIGQGEPLSCSGSRVDQVSVGMYGSAGSDRGSHDPGWVDGHDAAAWPQSTREVQRRCPEPGTEIDDRFAGLGVHEIGRGGVDGRASEM